MDHFMPESSEVSRRTIFVLNGSLKLSIQYLYTLVEDIFLISNIITFEKYLNTYLTTKTSHKIGIVIIFYNWPSLLQTVRMLYGISKNRVFDGNEENYASKYHYYLHRRGRANFEDKTDSKLAPPVGHGDRSLAFETLIIMNSSNFQGEILELYRTSFEQILRLITLKIGGSLAVVNDTMTLVSNPHVFVDFLRSVAPSVVSSGSLSGTLAPKPIYNNKDSEERIRLWIPSGWDSWQKIKILSESTIIETAEGSNTILLDNEVEFNRLNSWIDQFLQGKDKQLEPSIILNILCPENSKEDSTKDVSEGRGLQNLSFSSMLENAITP